MSLLECTLPSVGCGSPVFEKAKTHQQADALPKPHLKVFSLECKSLLLRFCVSARSSDLAGGFCRVGGPDRHIKGRRVVLEET